MALLPGLSLFQPQQQTLDYQSQQQPGESYWSWVKRKLTDAMEKAQQTLAISKENQGGYLPPIGTSVNASPVQVDQQFKPMPGQQQPSFLNQVDALAGQVANWSPLKNLPPYSHRINEWAQMKTNPNPPQGQQMPFMVPPEEIQGAGPATPAPMPQPLVPQPAPQQQETQQISFDPTMLGALAQQQTPMNFKDYWKSMQEMQPKREKSWMDSPLYPFSMAMLGLGQNLMTPPRFRGFNQNTFAPMMQALAMQAQNKQEGDNRALFEKTVASYPHFVQATRPGKSDWHFAYDQGSGKFIPIPGQITNLPREEKNYGITVGPGGASQIVPLPTGKYTTMPEAKAKETQPQVVPIMDDQGNINFTPVPQGTKATSPMRYQPSLLQQMQQMNQNKGGNPQGSRMVRLSNGQIISEDEAKRRGIPWR